MLAGTVHGTVYIHLRVGSKRTFTAEVNMYSRAGSLSGHASGSDRLGFDSVEFSGSLSISRGTGRYRHARAHALKFKGSVRLVNDAVTVRLWGILHY